MKCEPYRSVGDQDICAVVGHDEPWDPEEGCPVGRREFRQEREGRWAMPERPETGVTLVCSRCGTSVTSAPNEDGRVPLAPFTGWVIDPPAVYCPDHAPKMETRHDFGI